MAAEILTDASLWIDKYDLQSSMNAIGIDAEVETKDCTTFGAGARTYAVGQRRVAYSASGYPIDDTTDGVLFALLGQSGLPVTVGKSRAEGAVAFVGSIIDAGYSSTMSVSEVRSFSTTGDLSSRSFGRGRILSIVSGATTTANGTGYLLRAISATYKAFATLHVTTVTGTTPSMTVIIQSDDNVGFTTPTTVATFTAATAATSQQVSIDGPITDTYWRARYTITGTTPVFTFAVALGFEQPV